MSTEKEIIEAIDIIVQKRLEDLTQIYNGVIQTSGTGHILINGKTYWLTVYGKTNTLTAGQVVKVFVPQGNMSQAFILSV